MTSSSSGYITNLDSENELSAAVNTQITVAESTQQSSNPISLPSGCNEWIGILDEQYDHQRMLSNRLIFQSEKIRDLKEKLKKEEAELDDRRTFPVSSFFKNMRRGQQFDRNLDTKLQLILSKISKVEHLNISLKDTIERLRRQKLTEYDLLRMAETNHSKLNSDLVEVAKKIELISDQRKNLIEQSELVKSELLEELKCLQDEYNDIAIQQTINDISVHSSNLILEAHVKKHENSGRSENILGKPSEQNSDDAASIQLNEMKHKNLNAWWDILIKKELLTEQEQSTAKLEDELNQIGAILGPDSIDSFIETMINAEEINYNMYRVITEFTFELNELKAENDILEKSIVELSMGDDGRALEQEMKLDKELASAQEKADEYKKSLQKGFQIIASVEEPLMQVFKILFPPECDIVQKLLLVGIDDSNMEHLLALIEEEIRRLLTLSISAESKMTPEQSDDAVEECTYSDPKKVPVLNIPVAPSIDGFECALSSTFPSLNLRKLYRNSSSPLNIKEMVQDLDSALTISVDNCSSSEPSI